MQKMSTSDLRIRPLANGEHIESDDWNVRQVTFGESGISNVVGLGSPVYYRTIDRVPIEEIAKKFRERVLPNIMDLVDDPSNQIEGYIFSFIMAHEGWDWSNSRDVDFLRMFVDQGPIAKSSLQEVCERLANNPDNGHNQNGKQRLG